MASSFSQPPQKKQKMSITQTYFLAHTARGKLAKEAARADHDLRLLVGHANMLDELMIDLANAEQEQECWFNRTVGGAKAAEEEPKSAKSSAKHVQWADAVIEEPEEDWQVEDADSSDSENDEEDMEQIITATPISISKTTPIITTTTVTTRELSEEYSDDDEDSEDLALTRTESHHPPELTSDSDEESEDDSMPPSPPSTLLEFTEKERQAIATTSFYDKIETSSHSDHSLSESEQSHFLEDGFYLPAREQPQPAMIPAY